MANDDKPARKPAADRTEHGASEIAAAASTATEAGLASMRGAGPLTAEAATLREANITDEAKEAGPVFGDFLKAVGFAVAETQEKLDKTFRDTAHALSDEKINVIAVFEQQIDDNGVMTAGIPHVQELPLINYVMPTIMEVRNCSISADMRVSEFSTGNAFQIQGKTQSFNAGVSGSYGMFGGSVSGHVNYSNNSYDASGGSNTAQDTAVGTMHLEATIEPRENVQLPKPFITQKGPTLKLTLDQVAATTEETTDEKGVKSTRRKGTKATVKATLLGTNNGPLAGKTLEVGIDQPTVGYVLPTTSKTSNAGEITIELTRETKDEWKPVETTVRVWLGLVSQSLVVAL